MDAPPDAVRSPLESPDLREAVLRHLGVAGLSALKCASKEERERCTRELRQLGTPTVCGGAV